MISEIIKFDKYHPANRFNELLYPYLDDEHRIFSPELVGITNANSKYKMSRSDRTHIFSIEYVYEGKGVIHHGNEVFEAKAHDAFILHNKTAHNYWSDALEPWKKIWITVSGSLVEDLISLYDLDSTVLLPNYCQPGYFEQLFALVRDNPFEDRTKLAFILHKLFAQMAEFTKTNTLTDSKLNNDAIMLKKFIDTNIHRRISRDELVECIHASPSTVTRIFKKSFNQTPFDYILNNKIELAKVYLTDSNYTVDDIAVLLGFNSHSHLSSTFKKRTGMTPQEFRLSQATTDSSDRQ
ncbi:MAG: AraC family transcriptional regulator [Candidatus Ornithomonoglobus sp.]